MPMFDTSQTAAHYTIQCDHPETKETGCWIFKGSSHRKPGTSLSPVFKDCVALYRWMRENGWEHTPGGILDCRRVEQ